MVTIRDVAKAAGVSVSTVSIVMNDKALERSIPESTQERINRAMKELNYKPNLSARRLRSKYKQIPVIAFFWPLDFRITMMASFLNAFSREIQDSNFDCELAVRTYESGKLEAYDEVILKNGYNGVIIGECTEKDISHLEEINPSMPVVLVNRESEKFSTVSIDNNLAGKTGAYEFIRKGYTSAAVFASDTGCSASNLIVEAFVNHCRLSGIMIDDAHIIRDADTFDGGYCIAEKFCDMTERPEAVFCDSDAIALGALKALTDRGIRVPEDVSILTIDMNVSGITAYSSPSLSVIEMPNDEIGKNVIRLLNEKIMSGSQEASHIKAAPKLILRESFI